MQFHTVTDLSPRQALTAEGFLICRDVMVARCGTQLYHMSELPNGLDNGQEFVRVQRDPAEVFDPESVASFNGKPVIDDHTFEGVNPDNWNALALGYAANARRGTGSNDDALVADLIFTARQGINLVRNGKRAVSVGYDAEYTVGADGVARQHRIRANHIALVDAARCGPRCAIGDASWIRKEQTMDHRWFGRFTIDATPIGQPAGGAAPGGVTPAAHSTGRAGSRLVQRLPHSGFYIASIEGSDGVGLFEGVDPDTRSDPGEVSNGSHTRSTTGDACQRAARDQYVAARERDSRILAETNRRNRAFWNQPADRRHSAS